MPVSKEYFSSPAALLDGLINALQREYDEARKRGSGASYKLVDGVLVSKTEGGYIYRFKMSRIVSHIIPDTRVIISDVLGNSFRGEILSIDGDVLTAFLDGEPKSNDVEMKVDLSFLILELKKKLMIYKDYYRESLTMLPLEVFLYKPIRRLAHDLNIDASILSILNGLDENQRRGIIQSLRWSVAAIWGPPGTGKTRVLALIAILFALSGFRVLITTYTHAALDRTLSMIEQMLEKMEVRQDNLLIIRLGKSPNLGAQKFEEDRYIEYKIMKDMEDVKKKLELYNNLLNLWLKNKDRVSCAALTLHSFLNRLDAYKMECEQRIKWLTKIIEQLANTRERLIKEYMQIRERRPSIFERIFFRDWRVRRQITLAQIAKKIKEISDTIKAYEARLEDYGRRLFETNKEIKNVLEEIKPLTKDMLKMLASYVEGDDILSREEAMNIISSNKTWLYDFCWHGGREGLSELIRSLLDRIDKGAEGDYEEASKLRRELRLRANIVACTLTKCVTELFDQVYTGWIKRFDVVLIDECSMANLGYIWIASSIATRAILFGDPKQLPPITLLDDDSEYGILLSADIFSWIRLSEQSPIPNSFLNKQYRMGRRICELISNMFYGGRLVSETNFDGEIIFYDTTGLHARDRKTLSKSRVNVLNAFVVLKACRDLVEEGYREEDIAIVTPFRDQHHIIREILDQNDFRNVSVGTIHTFQGSERKVVIIDLVRSNSQGFSCSPLYYKVGERLLATAMSRAIEKLIIIGPYNEIRSAEVPALSFLARQIPSNSIKPLFLGEVIPFRPERVRVTASEQFFLSENEAIEAVIEDLKRAEKYAVIVSPYIKEGVLKKFSENSNVPITVYTRKDTLKRLTMSIIKDISDKVVIEGLERKIHLKAIIIDDHILYDGSMNFLSPTGALELVNRCDSYRNPKLWKLKSLFQPARIRS